MRTRHDRLDFGVGARRQSGHPAQHRHDHVVEGEHRRGRKAWQDHDRLAVAHRKAERLAGLERNAMRDDAGLAEPADDAMGQIARTFRRAAGEHQHVGIRQRLAHGSLELGFIVWNGAEENRLAAVLIDCGCDDGAIGVVDRGRPKCLSGLHQFITGGDHGNPRLPRNFHLGDAASRQHADLSRANDRAGAQQRLAARDVGSGIGHELARRNCATNIDRIGAGRLGVLHHDHRIGASRQRAAGGDRRCGPHCDLQRRRRTAVDGLAIQREPHRCAFTGG